MFCTDCGKQVTDNTKFCGECGASQVSADTATFNVIENCPSCNIKGWKHGKQCGNCGYIEESKFDMKATVTSNVVSTSASSKVYVASVISDKVPANIIIAIWLIWISTFAGISQMSNSETTNQGGMILFAFLFMVCLILWITVKLRAGKNWMRITYVIFTVLGSFMSIKDIQNGSILDLADVVLCIVTIFLLYSESASAYFKRKSSNDVEYILREK